MQKPFYPTLFFIVLSFLFSARIQAQAGYSSGSMGMITDSDARSGSGSYYSAGSGYYSSGRSGTSKSYNVSGPAPAILNLPPTSVVPEEIMNYHTHKISLPAQGEGINIDPVIVKHPTLANRYILQIGIAAEELMPLEAPPAGIMYVLDISGSMTGDRIENAKKAIIQSLVNLKEGDYFGLTVFDSEAEVVIPYGLVGDQKEWIQAEVEKIKVRGATDILKGLLLGLDQMQSAKDSLSSHSLLVLTDGKTNTGVTSKDEIIGNILEKTNGKIRVSAIGVGIDLQYDLLRDVTEVTYGQFHYVADNQDIEKICMNEFESMMYHITSDPVMTIELADAKIIRQIYGAGDVKKNTSLTVSLQPINYGLTQVIVLELEGRSIEEKLADITVSLSYTPDQDSVKKEISKTAVVAGDDWIEANKAQYDDIFKNYVIAEWSYILRDISAEYHEKYINDDFWKSMQDALNNELAKGYLESGDTDVARIHQIFTNIKSAVDPYHYYSF